MNIRLVLTVALFALAQTGTAAQDSDFTPDQIQAFERESEAKSDLYLARKVLQDGRVELLQTPLSDLQAASLSPGDLRILRNALFAKYGYRFKSADLQTFFSKFPWYTPQTDEVPSAKLTKTERSNVDLLQAYEKGFGVADPLALGARDLVGMWHASPSVGSGYTDRLFLYADGRFEYAANQMDGTKRLVSLEGRWRLEGRHLVVEASSETYQEGGTIVPPYASWGSAYVIDDAVTKTVRLTPVLELRFPLSDWRARDPLRGTPYLVFGTKGFWKLYGDPDQGRD